MKKILFTLIVLGCQSAFSSVVVPAEFLAQKPLENKSFKKNESINFADSIDHIMNVQQNSLENLTDNNKSVSLTQMLTSFSVNHSGLFGLSALSASSATTLFWTKKKTVAKEEVKSFAINANDDELSLQMKINEITGYLVQQGKVTDEAKLRENLDKTMRKGHELFSDLQNIESHNWKVGGFRLDLSIAASGVVAPFTKVGENVRLWLEWTRTSQKTLVTPRTKATRFVSNVLSDIDKSAESINMPQFELQSLYVGLGEDYKSGFFGFGATTFGFIGFVKFVKKPKTEMAKAVIDFTNEDYGVIHEDLENKSRFSFIPRNKIQDGIKQSLKFAQFFSQKLDQTESTHWELTTIRETATISQTGFFGLANLNTKGVFVFMFNRKKPQTEKELSFDTTVDQLTLIRLCFTTMLGYEIPAIANFELRPSIEFFWK